MNTPLHRLFCVGTAALTVVGAAVAASAPSSAAANTYYYKAVPLCAKATRAHVQCFAMRRVRVARGTPGARSVQPAVYPTGPAGGFTPADLGTAYGVTRSAATTQVIGIVDAFDDPNALADLNTFNAHYGLPAETASTFVKVNQTGGTTYPTADAGWAGEISLDLDTARGLCNKCKIVLVEATSSSFANLAIAENEAVTKGATVISNSYGGAESGTIPASVLSAYNHSGVVITASAGDHGMFDWDHYNAGGSSSDAPEIPSSLSTVVAVGGTTLYLTDAGARASETVWNENGSGNVTGGNLFSSMGATGGGCSTQVTAPSWQQSVVGWAGTTCGTKRLANDISALADPYTGYDIYDTYQSSGWQTYGGTSLASPLIAALWGLAGGSHGVAYPASTLYANAAAHSAYRYDVTSGGSGICDGVPTAECASLVGGTPNTFGFGTLDCAWKKDSAALNSGRRECDATTGYDGASGLGTPKGLNLFIP